VEGKGKENSFEKGEVRAPACGRFLAIGLPWPYQIVTLFFGIFIFFLILFWELWGMGQASWENGCTTLPFFEACSYTWEGQIFHSSWSLEILFFSKRVLNLEYLSTFISIVGILVSWKSDITKNSTV
jgi:hypothetical protein